MDATSITSEVAFETRGKQAGYLRVPHSVHRSAEGFFPAPILSIIAGDGATLIMTATSRKSIVNVVIELGSAGQATPDILRRTERGLHRNMYALDSSTDYVPDAGRGTRELITKGSIRADIQNLLEPLKALAKNVSHAVRGDAVCQIGADA